MSRCPSARELVGKRITAFRANPSKDGAGGTYHDPCITLDDGTSLRFVVQETDEGASYGVLVVRTKARPRSKP